MEKVIEQDLYYPIRNLEDKVHFLSIVRETIACNAEKTGDDTMLIKVDKKIEQYEKAISLLKQHL